MTMPSLVANYQKKVTANKLKTAYSLITQALVSSQNENGSVNEWDYAEGEALSSDNTRAAVEAFANKYFIPYFKVSKICGWDSKCQGELSGYAFVLADGIIIGMNPDNNSGLANGNMFIKIDLNGTASPNKNGKDRFFMYFSPQYGNKPINFMGSGLSREDLLENTSRGCNRGTGPSIGQYCGALIQYDGWEIKDNYPW